MGKFMGPHSMIRITIACPSCRAHIRTTMDAQVAICLCGHRIPQEELAKRRVADKTRPEPVRSRNHWRPIHRYPYKHAADWDTAEAQRWWGREWVPGIPSYGCRCKENYLDLMAKMGPEYQPSYWTSPEAMARSVWLQHNAVRAKLGQTPVTWEDAQAAATRPTVGFIISSYQPIGGTETFHRTLIPRLRQLGQVWIDGLAVSGQWHDGDPEPLQVPWYGVGYGAAQTLAARVDLAVVWGEHRLAEILPTDRPRVLAVHHGDDTSGWSNDCIAHQANVIDAAVAVSPTITSQLLGLPVQYIPNVVDPARAKGNPAGLRERWGIKPTDHVHLWAHRLTDEKRPSLAVEVARALPPGHVMVMAGNGPQEAIIRGELAETPQARYVGPIETPGPWLATSSTFLSLSTFEGYGYAVAEAILAGVPVVSTPTGLAAEPGMAFTLPVDTPANKWAQALVDNAGRNKEAARRRLQANSLDTWTASWSTALLVAVGANW